MRTCTKCGPRPLSAFYAYSTKSGRSGHHARCKRCQHEARKAHRRAYPAKAAAVARRRKLKANFGITPERYDEMLAAQDGVCAICRRPSPDGRRLHVDHCHSTKKNRGLLCHDCNRGLGIFKDSPALLLRAADYLGART